MEDNKRNQKLYSIILAAGEGKRMKSKHPKPMQVAGGLPLIDWVCKAASDAGVIRNTVVIGHGAEELKAYLGDSVDYAYQLERLETGHAVIMGMENLADKSGDVVVLCGDTPLVTGDTIRSAYELHKENNCATTVITAVCDEPTGYGRIIRKDGCVVGIVEEKDASEAERKITEINTGMFVFDIQKLNEALKFLTNDNAQGEYYLTDVLGILSGKGEKVLSYKAPFEETLGVNDREQLSVADMLINKRNVKHLMENGVRILNPDSVRADADVIVGRDTVIYPNTILEGKTQIGEDCVIGPSTQLKNTVVGDGTEVISSVATDSKIGCNTNVGPFAYLRPNSKVGDEVKVGDFVEVKNATIGNGTKISHLTYVGDADVGERVNFGCGTVTVNYDGINKHRTVIEDDCFIGCNSNLVSPVTLHRGAYTAAGSTITDEVPEDSLAIARSRQIVKEGWAKGKTKNNR